MKALYTNGTDRWLTPPELVEALGPFDTDPCCEPWMPWRTAARMLSLTPVPDRIGRGGDVLEEGSIVPGHERFRDSFVRSEIANGLSTPWEGRVWMNHPYSAGLMWACKMASHNRGIALTAAKSTDTEWGQMFLRHCSLSYFMAGRLLFHYPDGTRSVGKWLPNVLWAFGDDDAERLARFAAGRGAEWLGVLMKRRDR